MGLLTLFGFKKPTTGDRDWYDQLEFNIDRTDAHTHDGVTSGRVLAKNLDKLTTSVVGATASALSGGNFRHTITVPGALDINKAEFKAYVNGGPLDGCELKLEYKRISATQIEVFVNDNTMDFVIVYG